MDRFLIHGGMPLRGDVTVGGAKNAALPLLAASILTSKTCTLHGVPQLHDIRTMLRVLSHLGVQWKTSEHGARQRTGPPSAEAYHEGGAQQALPASSEKNRESAMCLPGSTGPCLPHHTEGSATTEAGDPQSGSPRKYPQPQVEGTRAPVIDTIELQAETIPVPEAPYDIVKTMRASSMILGPLLARTGRARVSLPGGCAIGARPMDQHLKALQAMGATIDIVEGYIVAEARRLHGAEIVFDVVTVTGTENIMMAATLAEGRTTLTNAACEPEVVEVANLLTKMGARIAGAGTGTIIIDGVESLSGTTHTIIPDRIQAGTLMIAAAMTGGDVTIRHCPLPYLEALQVKLTEAGATLEPCADGVRVQGPVTLQSVDVITAPHPGFATDLQAQWMAAMTIASGASRITETIFENRFMHVAELRRMGADITVDGHTALVRGVPKLSGAPLMATDLRASACLVLAALAAQGTTEIQRVYHIDRGYEQIERQLQGLGAHIERVPSPC